MAKTNPQEEASAPQGAKEELQAFGVAVGKHPAAIKGSLLAEAADKCAKDGSSDSAKALAELVVLDAAISRQAVLAGGGHGLYNTAEALLK